MIVRERGGRTLRTSSAALPDAASSRASDTVGMSSTTSLAMMVVSLLMLLAGVSKKRLEWNPRDRFHRRPRK
jgi:hypothetical protein